MTTRRTDGTETVATALATFRQSQQLPENYAEAQSWAVRLGPLSLRLPNFHWRRKAIVAHDIHHLVTNYPCSIKGECLIASWEFGAEPFRHPATLVFCLPLVFLGCFMAPRETWQAFRRGKSATSLHNRPLDPEIWSLSLDELRDRLHKTPPYRPAIAFSAVVALAAAILLVPILAIVFLAGFFAF
ncbi:hypothetical protein [Parvibaculum sp. MBR-TMA-1.3b-4.2]|jgi:hypothetical protein